jgi:hypothetical protein
MFGVNRNADVRYQNTRTEMLLSIEEIANCGKHRRKNVKNGLREKEKMLK